MRFSDGSVSVRATADELKKAKPRGAHRFCTRGNSDQAEISARR
jgi:hypothetical protein